MTKRLFKLLWLPALVAVTCVFLIGSAQPAHAAEVTLDSSTYGYGSTSEFSQSAPITVTIASPQATASKTAETLAPTGQSVMPVYVAGFSMVATAALLLSYVYYRSRQATSVQ